MSKVKTRRLTPPTRLFVCSVLVGAIICALSALPSCNVTRTITNESQFFQRGDTSVMIQTKTIESYDGTKKL